MKNSLQPWLLPVPVKQSTFISLYAADKKFNLQTDLSAISPFYIGDAIPKETKILHADLQTNADLNHYLRLGSGRSGFFRGKYLKGIGRTQLTGQWNDPDGIYHNSGILLPTGAIREFLITAYLRSQGKAHLVTPCTGILLKKLPKNLKAHQNRMFSFPLKSMGLKKLSLPAADQNMQAITVKTASFCRFSNLVWWLNNFPQLDPGSPNIGIFFETLVDALSGENNDQSQSLSLEPEEIASLLADKISLAANNLMETWANGIQWGSMHNNFTCDGRFLDLETPTVFSRPIIGMRTNKFQSAEKQKLKRDGNEIRFGFEFIAYLRQAHMFLRVLESRLTSFQENLQCNEYESKFISEFLEALRLKTKSPHPLASQTALIDWALPEMTRHLPLAEKDKKLIRALIADKSSTFCLRDRRKPKRGNAGELTFHLLEEELLARPEPHVDYSVYVPDFLLEHRSKNHSLARLFNESVIECDSQTTVTGLFSSIEHSIQKMKEFR